MFFNTNLDTLERKARAQCKEILARHVSITETIEKEKMRERYAKRGVSALNSLLLELERKLFQIQPSVDFEYNKIRDAHERKCRTFKCILNEQHKCFFSNKKSHVQLTDAEKALQNKLNSLNHEIANGVRVFKELSLLNSKKSKPTGRSKSISRESPICKQKRCLSLPRNSKLESLIETSDTVDFNTPEQNHEQELRDGVFNLHLQNFLFLF